MAEVVGVTSNVLKRVKRIVIGAVSGTAFTIDVDGRQYLITAKHVVGAITGENTTIQLCGDDAKCADEVVTILRCKDPIDIAVLVPRRLLTVTFSLPSEMSGMIIGQDVYFIGFPYADYALTTNTGMEILGFVRKAVFSAQIKNDGATGMYLDGTNNSGFSGGPVVYLQQGKPGYEFKVSGVISGYRPDLTEVTKLEAIAEDKVTPEERAANRIVKMADGSTRKLVGTGMVVSQNTGIVLAYSIDHAVELIRSGNIKGPKVK